MLNAQGGSMSRNQRTNLQCLLTCVGVLLILHRTQCCPLNMEQGLRSYCLWNLGGNTQDECFIYPLTLTLKVTLL